VKEYNEGINEDIEITSDEQTEVVKSEEGDGEIPPVEISDELPEISVSEDLPKVEITDDELPIGDAEENLKNTAKDKKKLNPLHMRKQRQIFAILHFTRNHLAGFMGLEMHNGNGA